MNEKFLDSLNYVYDVALKKHKELFKEIIFIDKRKVEVTIQSKYDALKKIHTI